jgi:hypothetical protein
MAAESIVTNVDAAKLANRSVTTLRRYTCGWCDQSLLQALKGNCASMYGTKCDPLLKVADWRAERN